MASNNENFKLVPMKYDLQKVNPYAALKHISELTLGSPMIDTGFMLNLYNNLLDRYGVKDTVFGFMPAPDSNYITRQVIGKDGYFFKLTTTKCEADFIWHDSNNKMFLFWGSNNFRVVKAMNAIRWRIHKINLEYADMPPLITCSEEELLALRNEVAEADAQHVEHNEVDEHNNEENEHK